MYRIQTIELLRHHLRHWRREGQRIALVPTMGNLHRGHIHLIEQARRHAERVVASVFVNPLQFGAGEDLENYPRTLAQDAERLEAAGCDLLFAPSEAEVYPRGRDNVAQVEVPGLSDILCGAYRPGHFRGVTTVVAKLFHMVAPDVALFGEKDFQQLAVIRRMAADLNMAVEIHGVSTVREADGLAMSSRNGYLGAAERAQAPELYRTLQWIGGRLQAGEADFAALERAGLQRLEKGGFRPDYLSIRRAADLMPAEAGDSPLVVLAAAWMGKARLIDNLLV